MKRLNFKELAIARGGHLSFVMNAEQKALLSTLETYRPLVDPDLFARFLKKVDRLSPYLKKDIQPENIAALCCFINGSMLPNCVLRDQYAGLSAIASTHPKSKFIEISEILTKLIDPALVAFPAYSGTVYRGLMLAAESLERLPVGADIVDLGYACASKKESVAEDFATLGQRAEWQAAQGKLLPHAVLLTIDCSKAFQVGQGLLDALKKAGIASDKKLKTLTGHEIFFSKNPKKIDTFGAVDIPGLKTRDRVNRYKVDVVGTQGLIIRPDEIVFPRNTRFLVTERSQDGCLHRISLTQQV